MAKQHTEKKSADIPVSPTQKLVPTENNGKWGFLDAATGEKVVPFIYDHAHSFSVGLALVRSNGWWGYIDKTGKQVILLIVE